MTTQVVRPAGASHETLWVLLGAALIVGAAAASIAWRVAPAGPAHVAGDGIDARFDLNAAEQGLHADLRVAADEVAALIAEGAEAPTPEALAQQALPPFAGPPGGDTRGAHRWQRVMAAGFVAYLGTPGQPDKAGALLLRVPLAGTAKAPEHDAHGHEAAPPAQVWLHRTAAAPAPTALDDSTLRRLGWQPVLSRFDAGVTRRQPH